MKKQILILGFLLGVAAILMVGTVNVQAQAAVIYPVDDTGSSPVIDTDSSVTVSILRREVSGVDVDITGTWKPVPGEDVQIVVKIDGAPDSGAILSLAFIAAYAADPFGSSGPQLTTSAYPGLCGNMDATYPADGRDFELILPNTLRPYDYGGMAVIDVTTSTGTQHTFVLPQDDNFDGVPNIYAAINCPSGSCLRTADLDTGPDASSPAGDGWTVIDEWRGWIVSGTHVRGNPNVKDLFWYEESAPQCVSTAGTFTGGGNPSTDVDLNFFASNDAERDDLLKNVNTLSSEVNLHQMQAGEFVDKFSSYDSVQRVILTDDTDRSIIEDRWINKYAIIPRGADDPDDPSGRTKYLKLVRIVQCLDLDSRTPLGRADKDPPNELFDYGILDKDNGSAVLFIHRIVDFMLDLIAAGESRYIKYLTCVDGSWTDVKTYVNNWENLSPSLENENVRGIIRDALGWYYGHEGFEHAYDVTGTTQGTRKVSYGYHHAEGACTNVDVAWTHKVDKKDSGFNKFYIPKFHGTSDKREIRVTTSQVLP